MRKTGGIPPLSLKYGDRAPARNYWPRLPFRPAGPALPWFLAASVEYASRETLLQLGGAAARSGVLPFLHSAAGGRRNCWRLLTEVNGKGPR